MATPDVDAVTTWLDLTGLVLVAAGVGACAWLLLGWPALGVGGMALLAGSRLIHWQAYPKRAPKWWRRIQRTAATDGTGGGT